MLILSSCTEKKINYQFQLLEAEQTGINFSNDLSPNRTQNIFNYMYFYNGSGIGAGDFNNDGLIDLYFSANMKDNKLYLNKGKLTFEDITKKAFPLGVKDKGWSNGVSVVDINQDGKLDIYVSQVGGFGLFNAHNLLLVCKEITKEGIPVYEEKSEEYGLDLVGLGTQATFFDYDLDGDLDMFQLNHSLHQNGTFARRSSFENQPSRIAGDRFFRNDNGHFIETTQKANIKTDALGYGLGIATGDINLDGYPDIYVCNDFHENDYLYINQKNGTFKDDLPNQINHTSQFSMGVDIGDINNDIFPEIITLDMLPYDKEILKRSEGEDSYNTYKYKLSWGYNQQFSRNNLQLNNQNNTFSEIGIYSNIFATDWSWAPLWLDFDNDGQKDLFISNGIPKRVNDLDYIMFISDEEVQQKIARNEFDENDKSLIEKIPEIKIHNKFFQNTGNLQFANIEKSIKNDKVSYSNGSVYADLDNDSDLDIITNNINDKAFIYENLSTHTALSIHLEGSEQNKNAIGAKCLVFKKNHQVLAFEKFPVRGFQSSMEIPMTIGWGNKMNIDSILLIWPDNRYQKIELDTSKSTISLTYQKQLPLFNYGSLRKKGFPTYQEISTQKNIEFKHTENEFSEFDRDALLPHQISTEGPALCVADINQDGLEDIFIGNARGAKGRVFLQMPNGKFISSKQPALDADSTYEDTDAVWVDINQDSFPDLLVVNGGNEFSGNSEFLQPRAYLNDGKGNLHRKKDSFDGIFITASVIKVLDFTGDNKPDIFIGGRTIPFQYGRVPKSYLLKNNGTGYFSDVTTKYSSDLSKIGMIKGAEVIDLDKDGDKDILLALEWGSIVLLENTNGKFTKKALTKEKGWWNFVKAYDFDNDGDLDILAGNLGKNSRFQATEAEPVRMYVNDFDKNGTTDELTSYFIDHQETLFASKKEAEKQFPFLKKRFIYARDFAKASISELLGEENIKNSSIIEANYFDNSLLINDGKGNFTLKALPTNAQFSPYHAAEIIDANGDKLPDALLMGNFYESNTQIGRYDADYGMVLINRGKGNFEASQMNGLQIKGQVRKLKKIKVGEENIILAARNNDYLLAIKNTFSMRNPASENTDKTKNIKKTARNYKTKQNTP